MTIYATIRCVDIETTDLDEKAADVCELGWFDVHATALGENGKPTGWVCENNHFSTLVKPDVPVTPGASAIHHLIDKDLKRAPSLPEAIEQMLSPHSLALGAKAGPVAFAAHHAKFERRFIGHLLPPETKWICTERCARHAWKKDAPGFSNQHLRYWLSPRGLVRAKAAPVHRAGPDAYVTGFTLRELLNRGNTVERLIKGTEIVPLLEICGLGRMRGKPYAEVDSGFLNWMLDPSRVADFSEEDVATARYWLEQRGAGGF